MKREIKIDKSVSNLIDKYTNAINLLSTFHSLTINAYDKPLNFKALYELNKETEKFLYNKEKK